MSCPFRLAVITDEISQDFEHSCSIAALDFQLGWIELRSLWNKSVIDLDVKETSECRRILKKYELRVTNIASPLFKVDWPGAPLSRHSEHRDRFRADSGFERQDLVLERCVELAKYVETECIRCFDFWRLDNPEPYRADMDQRLRDAAAVCEKSGLILLLENEMSCNTATGAEAARTLSAVTNSNFMLNWDPANAAVLEASPYPTGYGLLPKNRVGHCHCKDLTRTTDGGYEWAPIGAGVVDWQRQLGALSAHGYDDGVSLETHWRGAGTPEVSTRISMNGLKTALRLADILC